MALTAEERARYSRHLLLAGFGEPGQERLRAARVLIVGAGGLGSPAALYLAAAGVGTIGLIDGDRVDLSNLQRQVLFATAAIGQPKAEAARARLLELNPGITVRAHDVEFGAGNAAAILADYDLVVDGSDRLGTRYLVNDACVIHGRALVSAAIHRFEGQAMTYVPGRGPCYRCLFPSNADGVVPNCAEAGVLGVLPGVLGTIQATEAIKVISGVGEPLIGRLLTYDALTMRFQTFRFERRSDCAVCGERPTIRTPEESVAACATGTAPGALPAATGLADFAEYSAAELRRRLADPAVAPGLVLVDVRERWEFGGGHLPGSVNLPLGELAGRLDEIPAGVEPIFICTVGVRSRYACGVALAGGIRTTGHLAGGLAAWIGTG